MKDRIIIGESGQAGLPISAPVYEYGDKQFLSIGVLRWMKHENSFSLQQFREYWENGKECRGWIDVFCSTK